MKSRPLDFVIGGAQKSGTTTLDALLRLHPQIQMASVKETHFFDDETRTWQEPDYGALNLYFPSDDLRLRGEATPITLYWEAALERLRAHNAAIKLIFLLRNPVARAFSHWRMEFSRGSETLPFAQAIRTGRSRVRALPEAQGSSRIFSYVERGFYGEQLDRVFKLVGRDQVHCESFETFFSKPATGLRGIADFLGIRPFAGSIPDLHLNAARSLCYPCELAPEDRAYLIELFRDDVARLEDLLRRRFREWPEFAGRSTAIAT